MPSDEPPIAEVLAARLGHDLLRLQALEDLTRTSRLRLVGEAARWGADEAVIAETLGLDMATARRLLRQVQRDPQALDVTATEVINLATAGCITREEMMQRLLAMTFTGGTDDPTGFEGYQRGTWDEVHFAAARGLLTDAEYEELARRVAHE